MLAISGQLPLISDAGGPEAGVASILIFYIGAIAVLLSLYPWRKVVTGSRPFVLIFYVLNSDMVATILNGVVLTPALLVYNSDVYANTRMLYGASMHTTTIRLRLSE